jgi:hypothetical protein
MAAGTILPSSLHNCLLELINRSNQEGAGIRVILLSTTEGAPLGRVFAIDQPMNEDVLAAIESVWAPASKQLPFLGLDKLHKVTAIYDHGTLIHVYQVPLVRKRTFKGNRVYLCFQIRRKNITSNSRRACYAGNHPSLYGPEQFGCC